MASLQESFKAALENAQMAASLLSIEQDRAERDAARDWPHLRDCLVHTFSNASPIPLSEGDRPGDILWAANAIATLQARLKEEELLEALGWLRKLSIVAMKLVKTTARRPSSEEVKVKAEPPHFAPVETLILDSDDEASIDEKPIIPVDEKPAAAPPLSPPAPPASNASRPNRRSPARQASESVASSTSSTPAPTPAPPPARNDRRRSRAPGPEVKGEEKEAPPAKKPRARAKAPAPPPPLNYPEPLSVITNPFELPQNLNRPSPTTLKQMREVGSFHNEDFPGSNTGTFRKADMFGWRIFLSSWVNLGIDWESPKPGEPCVMLNAMKQDTKGIWVDSRWLELAREHLNSGAPIGVVVAAANSIANPADGGGKQWVPLGRYIVRDMGSAPAGAFSRASKEGRDAALASLRQHAIKSLDWSIQRAGLFRNTD